MEEKKLGLKSVISVSVGLVIATSCLVSLGQGAGTIGVTFIFAMVIACLFNMTTIASLSELNALMPNTTGGLAQYTLACLSAASNDDFHGRDPEHQRQSAAKRPLPAAQYADKRR